LSKLEGQAKDFESKLAYERKKFESHDKEAKAAEKKFAGVEKEFKVCECCVCMCVVCCVFVCVCVHMCMRFCVHVSVYVHLLTLTQTHTRGLPRWILSS